MKLNKMIVSVMAGTMVLSLAACGNKSATETKKDSAESSRVVKKHDSKKKNIVKSTKNSENDSNNSKASVSSSVSSKSNASSITNVERGNTRQSVSQGQTQSMSETDARNLVKEHLSNQRANALEAGKGEPTQPTVASIDGFSARQNGTNDWTVSGTYGGRTYTYHVTPSAITGA